MADHFIDVVPAQQRVGKHWYMGSADAVFQNLNLIYDTRPRDVCVFGGDHIYKMEIGQMLDFHRDREALLTIAAIPVPIEQAKEFGVIVVDDQWRVVDFQEKPDNPTPMPNDPTRALVSMGNYIFRCDKLVEELVYDAQREESAHDFGKNILPRLVEASHQHVFVYDFSQNMVPGQPETERGYWRDVGTVDAYWQASMDLIEVVPEFDLYNRHWPMRTLYEHFPPAKFVQDKGGNPGSLSESTVPLGCYVVGASVSRSVLGPWVRIDSGATVEDSIIFERVVIGQGAVVHKAILDKEVVVEPGATVGVDRSLDLSRGFTISDSGVTVVAKGLVVSA